jgi:hypothetical protein
MEELSKKDILTLIGENVTSIRHSGYEGFDEGVDLQEMPPIGPDHRDWPRKKGDGRAPDPDKPIAKGINRGKLNKWTRLYALDNEDKVVEHVGWFGRHPETDQSVPIVFTCEWDELIEKYPDLIPKLKEKFGTVNLVEKECLADNPRGSIDKLGIKPIPGSDEVVKVTDTQYKPSFDDETGSFKTTFTKEKIGRTFYNILKNELEIDQEFKNALKKFSLPQIIVMNTKHRNSYSTINNEEINFESHNINLYEKQKSFVDQVMSAIRQPDPEKIEDKGNKPLRRLYNKIYSNWSKTRFVTSREFGKTPVFKLDKGDFPNEQKFEVMVSSDIKIKGKAAEKNDEGEVTKWVWTIEYLVEYAKKSPTELAARKMIQDGEIKKSVEIELSEPKKFDGKTEIDDKGGIVDGDTGGQHPLTDVNIVEGLKQVLSDFKEELTSPKQKAASIRRAIIKIEDMGGERALRQTNLNEEKIREIVKQVIKQNK